MKIPKQESREEEKSKNGRQTDAFKKMHPEQFSDSKMIRTGLLDRDFLDFFLETLTSKSLEKEFEDFCRLIAQAEVCPNLLPHTGPTGGGDSKVDSETYPVSEALSLLWYYGDGNNAATERWAFAVSAKKDWKPKVRSDVAKVAKVNSDENRGYTKVFFMSNQYIADKKRADIEDELRSQYNLDVRIFDRTWLLDKVFEKSSNKEIAITCFGFSDSFLDISQIGVKDYERKHASEQLEILILKGDAKPSELVSLSKRSLELARELEVTKTQILGLIDRNKKIANEHGTVINVAEAIYDAAWTIYWWYSDPDYYYEYYKEFEAIVLAEDNVSLFKDLATLWINLFSLSLDDKKIRIEEHTKKLIDKYTTFINDPSKPNTAIEAKAAYQMTRVFLGDTPDDIVNDILEILDDSFGHLDLDLYPLSRAIQEFPIFESAIRYDELFERIVATMSKQKQESEAATMLANRGRLLKDKKPYEALTFFSRTLCGLYNKANKDQLIRVVMEMADIFSSIGLLWAARNFYYYDFCLCLNQYLKFGEISPMLFISTHELKYIELRLGRVLYATNFASLANISEQLYPEKLNWVEAELENFDFILAIQILRTPFEVEKCLGQLPAYFDEHGYFLSSAAMKYELGYIDEEFLSNLNNNQEAFDDLIGKLKNQPSLEKLNKIPWYGIEKTCLMQTSVLGCSINLSIASSYDHGEIEVGATILATIESFFGTGVTNELVSLTGKIEIELVYEQNSKSLISGKIRTDKPNVIQVVFREYETKNIIDEQRTFSDFMMELLSMVISIMFPYSTELKKIEKMIKNDAAFDRSQAFSNSVFYGLETLGKTTFSFATILNEYTEMQMIRTEKYVCSISKADETVVKPINPEKIIYEPPPDKADFFKVSNTDIHTASIINLPLWNISEWKAVVFLVTSDHSAPPIMSLAFMKEAGVNIFNDWMKEIGPTDKNDEIGIRIIKSIDKEHPFWYRVIIGPQTFPLNSGDKRQIVAMPTRIHTMQPDNDVNLTNFEKELLIIKRFALCPSLFPDIAEQPRIHFDLMIQKNATSISICNACDVPDNDFLFAAGILPTDNPTIPAGKEDSPILSIIQRKKANEISWIIS